jgi:serine/threonine protein kinase
MQPYPGYRLRQRIGRGGFAEVWEAVNSQGETIALKFMPCGDNLAASKEIRAIRSIQQLVHSNLIRIDQVFANLGYIIIAMEMAEGSLLDLFDAYQMELGTPIAPEQVSLYLAQAAEALDFLNKRQHHLEGRRVAFQHCDVKPSNMLLFGDTVKLSDFGLATSTTSTIRMHRRSGTLDYAAPEVFQGRLSEWTDQYALAVTYCVIRGGRLPFSDTPPKFESSYVRPAPDLTMLPPQDWPIVSRALSPVPQDRWPTCSELIAHLARVIQ